MAYRRRTVGGSRIQPPHHDPPEFTSQIDSLFDRWALSKPGLRSRVWPAFDTFERSHRFVVRAELPGVAREDILVRVVGDALEIEGMRREGESKGEDRPGYGRLWRRVVLPVGCNPDRATAWFGDGVLEVVVPFQRSPAGLRNQWAW